MKFREHRELLVDSMATVKEFEGEKDLVEHLQKGLDCWPSGIHDLSQITIKKYGEIDERIGWDTYIVYLDGYGVLGFTDGPAL